MVIWARRYLDRKRVELAIEAAERLTSGQIIVSVAGYFWGDIERAAQRTFERLAVRNGVLLFVVPGRRRFVVLGGCEFNANVVAEEISAHLRAADLTRGVIFGVARIAAHLAPHFPPAPKPLG